MFAHRRCNEPSAAELLEASKSLYVKTDALKERRLGSLALQKLSVAGFAEPGQPHLFTSPSEEDIRDCDEKIRLNTTPVLTSPMPYFPLLTTPGSAFRPFQSPPPRPPKSDLVKRKAARQSTSSPPPLPPRQGVQKSAEWKPTPKPRLSKMNSSSLSSPSSPPRPRPRRQTMAIVMPPPMPSLSAITRSFDTEFQVSSTPTYHKSKKALTTSTPNLLSVGVWPSVIGGASASSALSPVRRRLAAHASLHHTVRAPTPLLKVERSGTPPPSALAATEHLLSASSLPSPGPSSSSSSRGKSLESSACSDPKLSLSSPTSKDSGVHPSSDDEDPRLRTFVEMKDEVEEKRGTDVVDSDDSVFTSITDKLRAAREEVDAAEKAEGGEERGRPLSVLEKNARVMRWIHGCELVQQPPSNRSNF